MWHIVSYDIIGAAFLSKISEYTFLAISDEDARTEIIDGYLKRAVSEFRKNCLYDLSSSADDENRCFDIEIEAEDIDEIVNILSDGMIIQWLKPYIFKQEVLQNIINTRDFTQYSNAELLNRLNQTYKKAQDDYKHAIREYSFNHAKLKELHA